MIVIKTCLLDAYLNRNRSFPGKQKNLVTILRNHKCSCPWGLLQLHPNQGVYLLAENGISHASACSLKAEFQVQKIWSSLDSLGLTEVYILVGSLCKLQITVVGTYSGPGWGCHSIHLLRTSQVCGIWVLFPWATAAARASSIPCQHSLLQPRIYQLAHPPSTEPKRHTNN